MRVILFVHSLLSDWNHGNAHFLRGIATELTIRGHDVRVFEHRNAWSAVNLQRAQGTPALALAAKFYPYVRPIRYDDPATLDLDQALDGADLVIVHEWNTHELVARIGAHRKKHQSSSTYRYRLLFHDTHHRSVTEPELMAQYDLSGYDAVLAFGRTIAEVYAQTRWAGDAPIFVWHEAADIRVFRPLLATSDEIGDLVWIGNWGDGERTNELREMLLEAVRELQLNSAYVYGVRYPDDALKMLAESNITYGGWLPNFRVPEVFALFRATIHIPRRPYVDSIPGIPTIRVFEALACGIPLVSAPWRDDEELFTPGADFLVAEDGEAMKRHLRALLSDPALRREIAARGRQTILQRHTCAHRASELLAIAQDELGVNTSLPLELTLDPPESHIERPSRPSGALL